MSKLTLNDVEELITHQYRQITEIEQLILSYAALKEKLENVEEQSFFFKKGITNHRKDLKAYKERFDDLRTEINNTSKDELLAKIREDEEKAEESRKRHERIGGSEFMYRMKMGIITNRINHYKELLAIKSRCREVQGIDYYLEQPEALKNLIGG